MRFLYAVLLVCMMWGTAKATQRTDASEFDLLGKEVPAPLSFEEKWRQFDLKPWPTTYHKADVLGLEGQINPTFKRLVQLMAIVLAIALILAAIMS